MPKIKVNGVELYYEEHGSGEETVVLSHGLLWSCRMFDKQIEALKDTYRVIAYDHRGQGQSQITAAGYDMDTLTEDAAALLLALKAAPCHFVGLSMGGFVGMRLAVRYPELLRSLVLIETTADEEPRENVPKYKLLNFLGRWLGFGVVADRVMPIMFGKTFLSDPARAEERAYWRSRLIQNDRIGTTRAVLGVVNRPSFYHELDKIKTRTLILVGDEDVATVPAKSERMRAKLPNAQLHIIPQAGHSSSVEQPEAVNAALRAFLESKAPD
ncbi:MAG: alpha/beta hydrolase [Anaerolineae bacterium]|nr:alpha/beta hydrolase [Anaerolineae bacterium]MDW8173776.1 alpha/beta fold hydrolase [Anaerolineae bacterium]